MSRFRFLSQHWLKDPERLTVTFPKELKFVFWKLDHSSEPPSSSPHPLSGWSVMWAWLLLWTFFLEIVCLRSGRRERHMLAVEIMLLCFLLSRLSYFQKRVKCHVMWFLSFFVSVTVSQREFGIFFLLPSVIRAGGFYISRSTFYTLEDSISGWSTALLLC